MLRRSINCDRECQLRHGLRLPLLPPAGTSRDSEHILASPPPIAMTVFIDAMSPAEVTVRTSDLLVATAESADPLVDGSVLKALQLLRRMLKVDAVFVAELVDGARVTRVGETNGAMPMNVGQVVPLEQTYCRLVLEGKLPEFIPDVDALAEEVAPPGLLAGLRGHVMTPVVLKDGRVYGTLCCLSASPLAVDQEKALLNLRRSAKFVADALDGATH